MARVGGGGNRAAGPGSMGSSVSGAGGASLAAAIERLTSQVSKLALEQGRQASVLDAVSTTVAQMRQRAEAVDAAQSEKAHAGSPPVAAFPWFGSPSISPNPKADGKALSALDA
jgi:hypothetical protein